ncbi:caspase family protein [Saccharopolyspora sp. NPDC050389]|uniref:caspase family protein n=1 Tax=Saccharopolyspora sp. NPDC050389 TaxID=3155516 RepID=UPI00340AD6AC
MASQKDPEVRLPNGPKSRALLFGAGRFNDERLPDLPAVENNLADLAEVLTSSWGAGLSSQHCVVLPDPAGVAVLGTHLEAVARQAEDVLLVYYAGHGLLDHRGELYLSLPQTKHDLLAWTGLPFGLLRNVLASSAARNRVLIIDSCFSGRAIEAMSDPVSVVTGQVEIDGTYTLTSSPANSVSNAPEGARHTAFTGEMLKLLRNGDPQEPELLSLGAIYRNLRLALHHRGLNPPQHRGTATADLLALAQNRAYVPPTPAPAPLPEPAEPTRKPTEFSLKTESKWWWKRNRAKTLAAVTSLIVVASMIVVGSWWAGRCAPGVARIGDECVGVTDGFRAPGTTGTSLSWS